MVTPGKSKSKESIGAPPPGLGGGSAAAGGDYTPHIWQSLDSINRELGKISTQLDTLSADVSDLKGKVGKHDKIVIYGTAVAVAATAIIGSLWWIYKLFENHIHFS